MEDLIWMACSRTRSRKCLRWKPHQWKNHNNLMSNLLKRPLLSSKLTQVLVNNLQLEIWKVELLQNELQTKYHIKI